MKLKRSVILLPAVTMALLAWAAGAVLAPDSTSARPYNLGLFDPRFFTTSSQHLQEDALAKTVRAGATTVRVNVAWFGVAPTKPRTPRNHCDPAYNWRVWDLAVMKASARGLRVLLSFAEAPRWAEGISRPQTVALGAWRPKPQAVGDFAYALASRYDGGGTSSCGGPLPRVKHFQIWNEPNLPQHMSPTSPNHYRKMLNAGYRGVKQANPTNYVVAAGMGPFGDYGQGGDRVPPAKFVRELFCLNSSLRPKCRKRAYLDALAQHIYPVRGPRSGAHRDDVAVPDVAKKIGRPLQAARRTGRALPASRKEVWITELGWGSKAPYYSSGVPLARHARWLEESLYLLWRQKVDTVLWFRVQDGQSSTGGRLDHTGLHFRNGASKPALRAYHFPFVTERTSRRQIRLWGKAPARGTVLIQRSKSGGWRTVRRVGTNHQGIYTGTMRLPRSKRGTKLRAQFGTERSLVWEQR